MPHNFLNNMSLILLLQQFLRFKRTFFLFSFLKNFKDRSRIESFGGQNKKQKQNLKFEKRTRTVFCTYLCVVLIDMVVLFLNVSNWNLKFLRSFLKSFAWERHLILQFWAQRQDFLKLETANYKYKFSVIV